MTDITTNNNYQDSPENDPQQFLLKPKEAAKALAISKRLLWSKTNSGEIPCVRINTAVRYPKHLLLVYINNNVTGGGLK